MESNKPYKIFPEDIEIDYFLSYEDIHKDWHELSYKRQLINNEFQEIKIEFTLPRCLVDGYALQIENVANETKTTIGDLFITIYFLQKGFERDGNDARLTHYINSFQAKNGSKIDLTFLNENLSVKIPKNVKNGQILRVKGYGYSNVYSESKGDLLIKININNLKYSYQFLSNLIKSFFSAINIFLNGSKNLETNCFKSHRFKSCKWTFR